jgi:hypothetical protein
MVLIPSLLVEEMSANGVSSLRKAHAILHGISTTFDAFGGATVTSFSRFVNTCLLNDGSDFGSSTVPDHRHTVTIGSGWNQD